MSIGGALVQVGGGAGGGGGGGSGLPVPLALLDFDAAVFTDPNGLLTSWNQTSLGNVEVVYAGTYGSTTGGFRPGGCWTWSLADLSPDWVASHASLIGEIYAADYKDGTVGGSGAQLGFAIGDNADVSLSSGAGHEYYDSGTNDERCRGYTSTSASGNTGRAGLTYIDVRMVPRPGSGQMVCIGTGLSNSGEFFQSSLSPISTAATHFHISVGQSLTFTTGTYNFSAKAAILPWSGLRGA